MITGGGIVHDMRADGTEANGVHDVAEFDKTTPITVVASYEDGVHVLRPVGVPVEVTRRIERGRMVWSYVAFTAVLERVDTWPRATFGPSPGGARHRVEDTHGWSVGVAPQHRRVVDGGRRRGRTGHERVLAP